MPFTVLDIHIFIDLDRDQFDPDFIRKLLYHPIYRDNIRSEHLYEPGYILEHPSKRTLFTVAECQLLEQIQFLMQRQHADYFRIVPLSKKDEQLKLQT